MQYFLFYGTLRKNGTPKQVYNYQRFGGQEFVKELRLPGFLMVNLRYYPCLIEGDGEVTVELHKVDDNAAYQIESMEASAGYSSKLIDIDGIQAKIFYHDRKLNSEDTLIPSGNWCS